MTDVNGQLKDVYVNGVWQNPYQQFTTLAISPSITNYDLTYGNIKLPSNLWLTNMGADVSSIQFDADDGQGYRTVQMDNNIAFNYADTGIKHWVFRINLTNNQQLYTHTKVHISNTSNFAGSGTPVQRGAQLDVEPITATKAYNNVLGQCKIVISYRNDNDRVIRKPLIVAEGFDMGHITKPEAPEGKNTYESFIERIRNSESNSLKQLLLNGTNSEYDIIYINWSNGTDYLQRNAYVLEAVIKWVNDHKQALAGVRQQNVVMGLSMGSVLARMALGDMERSNPVIPHETRLYISMDGPMQGSNFPLGMQAAVRHAAKMYMQTGNIGNQIVPAFGGISANDFASLPNRPGNKQLLIQRIDENYNTDNATHVQFMNELRDQWHYPTTTRIIVVSNGSECALDQELPSGSKLVYLDGKVKTRFLGDLLLLLVSQLAEVITIGYFPSAIFVIPGPQQLEAKIDIRALIDGGGSLSYYGKIRHTKKVLWLVPFTITLGEKTYNAPTGLLAYDGYPGSFWNIEDNVDINFAKLNWAINENINFQFQRRFMHVLTTSALDIGGGFVPLTNTQYFAKYIGANPPLPPYNVPTAIANFTTAYNQNPIVYHPTSWPIVSKGGEWHTRLYLRNANFIAAELNGNTTLVTNCNAFCDGGVNNWPTSHCNGAVKTYTVPGVSSGTTVTWSASPQGYVTIAPNVPNGSIATITPTGLGESVIITATLTGNAINACGTKSFSKTVALSSAPSMLATYNSPYGNDHVVYEAATQVQNIACVNTLITATPYALPAGYWVDWSATTSGGVTWYPVGNNLTFTFTQPGQTLFAEATIHNECGSSTYSYNFVAVNVSTCGGGGQQYRVIASPNPTPSNLNIKVDVQGMQQNGNNNPAWMQIREVTIYDKFGVMRKRKQFGVGSQQVNIPVQDLPNDVYNVHVTNGVHKVVKMILIQR